MIFFHGVSPGLCVYLPFLNRLTNRRPSVLVEIPHITTLLNFRVSRRDILIRAVREIADRHEFHHGMVVVGHSFGSICAGWVERAMSERIKQVVLIDPVCLLLL